MSLDGRYDLGNGYSVRVEGLQRVVNSMVKAGNDAEDMKDLMNSIGMIVVRAAKPPYLTGDLQSTIRAGRGKTKAVVRAGYNSKRLPYAAVQEYGWPAHSIRGTHYMTNALQNTRSQLLDKLDEGIEDILKKNNLE